MHTPSIGGVNFPECFVIYGLTWTSSEHAHCLFLIHISIPSCMECLPFIKDTQADAVHLQHTKSLQAMQITGEHCVPGEYCVTPRCIPVLYSSIEGKVRECTAWFDSECPHCLVPCQFFGFQHNKLSCLCRQLSALWTVWRGGGG